MKAQSKPWGAIILQSRGGRLFFIETRNEKCPMTQEANLANFCHAWALEDGVLISLGSNLLWASATAVCYWVNWPQHKHWPGLHEEKVVWTKAPTANTTATVENNSAYQYHCCDKAHNKGEIFFCVAWLSFSLSIVEKYISCMIWQCYCKRWVRSRNKSWFGLKRQNLVWLWKYPGLGWN